jgi:hypothetical protein
VAIVKVGIVMDGERNLSKPVHTIETHRRFASLLDGSHNKAKQDGEDRDDDK